MPLPLVFIYAGGPVHCSVCASADMTRAEVEAATNAANPTGIPSGWKVSAEPTFKTGQANPCSCEKERGRKHWLMECSEKGETTDGAA